MGESPEKTHISFESQSEDRSRKTEVGPQDALRQRQRSVLCNPVLVRETRISQGECYVPICVFPGQPRLVAPIVIPFIFLRGIRCSLDFSSGLEIALDCVFDCKYPY